MAHNQVISDADIRRLRDMNDPALTALLVWYLKQRKWNRVARRKYDAKPQSKERIRERNREYNARPDVKARKLAYAQRPEVKERRRQRYQKKSCATGDVAPSGQPILPRGGRPGSWSYGFRS